jgi:L-lactate dehydrogenase complex protein LldG
MVMANTHEEWLQQLTRESRDKQESFMNNIADRMKRPRVMEKPNHPFKGAPGFWGDFQWGVEERVAQFTESFRSVGGHVEHMEKLTEVKSFIVDKAQELGAKYVLMNNEPELTAFELDEVLTDAHVSVWNNDPSENWKARSAEADFGVVMADYAVAHSGSVVVLSNKDKGRSVSLLPTILYVIIPIERLKTRLGEVLINFDQAGRESLPAGIHFISGPSRSADIENDLTIGVHGPGVVYALIVGNLSDGE